MGDDVFDYVYNCSTILKFFTNQRLSYQFFYGACYFSRYGMLSNESRDNMEMRPLSEHEDDDDDDMTLFDMTNRKGKR